MTIFTKGPWEFGVRADGSLWLSIGDPRTGRHYQADLHCSEADARLIVASPKIYEALQEAKVQVEILQERLGIKDTGAGTLSIINTALASVEPHTEEVGA